MSWLWVCVVTVALSGYVLHGVSARVKKKREQQELDKAFGGERRRHELTKFDRFE